MLYSIFFRPLSVFLLMGFLLPISLFAQVESGAELPVVPEYILQLKTQADFEALTPEQQAEAMTYLFLRGGASRNELTNSLPLSSVVNCFDYYTFGSVQVDLSGTVGSTVSGVPLTLTGTITNDNSYPVVNGSVYVKIFRTPADGTTPVQGYDVVDQFFAADDLSLSANGSIPFTYTWDVPAHLPSGNYQAAFFFTAARKFNLLGLPFTDDVIGNRFNFTIAGESDAMVAFDKETVTIDSAKYFFAAFTPKVSATATIPVAAVLTNHTTVPQRVTVTTRTYRWDQQYETNLVDETVDILTLSPAEDRIITHSVTDTSSAVYLVVMEAAYGDTRSIVNIRFTRDGVPATRINFPGVVSYPLTKDTETTLFSCLHGAGTLDLIEGGKLDLTLTTPEGAPIHSYTYEGGVTGAMMAVKSAFTPKQTYKDFNLTAILYHDGVVVDQATMQYRCSEIGGTECVTAAASDTAGTMNASLILLGLALLIVGGIVVYRLRGKSHLPPTTPTTPIAIFLALVLSVSFFGGAEEAEAKSVTWSTTNVPELFYYWNQSRPYPNQNQLCSNQTGYAGYAKALNQNANVSITYRTSLMNFDTGAIIPDGATLPVGTRVQVIWNRANSDISWFGTGYSADSPFGTWQANATDPADYCSNFFVNNVTLRPWTWGVYIPLSINPPAMSITNFGNATCSGTICTITGAGALTISVRFSSTYGNFYYRYNGEGICETGCHLSTASALRSCSNPINLSWTTHCGLYRNGGWANPNYTQPYSLNIPEQTITYNLSVISPNDPPDEPTVVPDESAPGDTNSHAIGVGQNFTISATDPDTDQVRYGIDWDMNSTVDQWVPATGYVNSGVAQNISRTWITAGVKQFQVLAEDNNAGQSGWTPHQITICDAGYIWNVSSCTRTYSLTVNSSGALSVPITASNAAYSGNTSYTRGNIISGTSITLTAPPTAIGNKFFNSWTGCNATNATARTCTIAMAANSSVSVTYFGGDLTSSGCTIDDGDSSCSATLAWDVDHVSNGYVTENGEMIQTGISSDSSRSVTLTQAAKTYRLYNGDDTLLDTVSLSATCNVGSVVADDGTCGVPTFPIISLEADPALIRSGQQAQLTARVTLDSDVTCTVLPASVIDGGGTINHVASPGEQSYSITTKPLTSKQLIQLSCPVPNFASLPPVTDEVSVQVLPTMQEI